MWRDYEEYVGVESKGERRPLIRFVPDWLEDRVSRSQNGPSVEKPRDRKQQPIDSLLVSPPSNAFMIVDTSTMVPPCPEPRPEPEREPAIGDDPQGDRDRGVSNSARAGQTSAKRLALSRSALTLASLGLTSFLCGGLAVGLYDRTVTSADRLVVKALTEQMTRIEHRVDNLPGPVVAPDLQPLRSELKEVRTALEEMRQEDRKELRAALDELKQDSIAFQQLRNRLDQTKTDVDVGLASMKASLKSLQDEVSRAGQKPSTMSIYASPEILKRGTDLFQEGDCVRARELFRVMRDIYLSDARVWYYSALSEMRYTRQWPGEGDLIFRKGIECEQAGTPPASEIESAFASLTKRDGRDWLAYYRSLVRPLPTLTPGP